MRVLFTTQPYFGHWHPLVPFARALEEGGHEVAFASNPGFCSTIEANGFRCFPVGRDETKAELQDRMEYVSKIPGTERAAVMWVDYFAGMWAERDLPDMLALLQEWHPDLVVRGDVEFTGCVAAERHGIPHAAVQVTAYRPHLHELIAPRLDRLRHLAGLAPVPAGEMLHRYLLICPMPLSFLDPGHALPPVAHPVLYAGFNASGDEHLPVWVETLPKLPTVYATLGTVVNRNTAILQAILDALSTEQVNIIMTTGHDVDPAVFSVQHSGTGRGGPAREIRIERYIPQSLLLPYCDLVINHGGSGTVRDALSYGLPMVIIPVSADQHVNANRCADLGAARVIAPEERTPDAIREAANVVLQNSAYRQCAERMRDEIRSLPGLEFAVELLERLARERKRLIWQPDGRT